MRGANNYGTDHGRQGARMTAGKARETSHRPALRRGVRGPPTRTRSRRDGSGSACRAAGSRHSDNSGSRAITVCSRRSHQHRSTSANTTVPAVKRIRISRLPVAPVGLETTLAQALHPIAVDCARKDALGTTRPSLGTPSRFALNNTLNPARLSARPPESNDAISAVPSRCLRP